MADSGKFPVAVEQKKLFFELRKGKIERATKESAAFDLFYNGTETVFVGDSPIMLSTGVYTAFDPGLVAIIKEKSGLALKGLEVKGGVIDADYRDEWKVICRNPVPFWVPALPVISDSILKVSDLLIGTDWKPIRIDPGMKIAQFILVGIPDVHFYSLESAELIQRDSVRIGGIGSTGK